MELHKPEYEERLVAFVDILGFGALVASLGSRPELHHRLHYALTYIKSYRESSRTPNTAHSSLEVSVFSDSIAITAEPLGAFSVLWACGWLQAQLLYSGILTRGGIASGPTFHEEDLLYGEGFLAAYQIESTSAVYPRIVVSPGVFDRLSPGMKKHFLDEDSDGLWFIDPFRFDAMAGGASELAADGYDPREVYFDEVGKHIANAQKEAKQLDHLAKWNWIANRYRLAASNYIRNRETNLAVLLKEAEQIAPGDADRRP